ncbi:P2X purinoceptor 7-like [Ornithodoros turicata]|uniref:P2X purinoceptor 7-like n=1 Tax=Ornithodoros turicata TaxID=34597 RepID=UPI003139E911
MAGQLNEHEFFGTLTPWEARILQRCRDNKTTLYETPVLPEGASLHGVGDYQPSEPSPSPPRDGGNWCACGSCTRMPTAREDICCRDIAEVRRKLTGCCITAHPEFGSLCLSAIVLEVVGIEYRRILRHIAYRHFTSWTWGPLPPEDRRVLPSCVVTAIRKAFPSRSGSYRGFRSAK